MAYIQHPYSNLSNYFLTDEDVIDQWIGNTLWCWGRDLLGGQLGDNTTVSKSSPVQTVAGGTNWKIVSNGSSGFHSAGIKTDGTLWLWGNNQYGQLGDNTTTSRSSPVQTVISGSTWTSVGTGVRHTVAVKTDGTLWSCGENTYGVLGDNTITDKQSPVQTVAGGSSWKQVSGMEHTTAAIKVNGTLWLWGRGDQGQLGDNTIGHKSSPVQTVAGGTNWKQVSCGSYHVAAIKTDGTLWTWGWNQGGLIGNNTSSSRSSPVQTVAAGTNWKQVSCGYDNIAAVKTDGTLWGWGSNSTGQIGDLSTTSRSSPVQTIAGGTDWKQVATGNGFTVAIKTNGTLWAWGTNTNGELGSNSNLSTSGPLASASGSNWKQVGTSKTSSLAVTFTDLQ